MYNQGLTTNWVWPDTGVCRGKWYWKLWSSNVNAEYTNRMDCVIIMSVLLSFNNSTPSCNRVIVVFFYLHCSRLALISGEHSIGCVSGKTRVLSSLAIVLCTQQWKITIMYQLLREPFLCQWIKAVYSIVHR